MSSEKDVSVAVLGGGAGAHAMAVDLSCRGIGVALVEHPDLPLPPREIEMVGVLGHHQARLDLVTHDFREAVRHRSHLFLVMPAFAHRPFFELLAPLVEPSQTICLWPGNYGALELREYLGRLGAGGVFVTETNTLPYGARLRALGSVDVLLTAPRIRIWGNEDAGTIAALREFWPGLELHDHFMDVALANPNPVIHPAATICNAGAVERSGGDYYLYRDGMTASVAQVIRAVWSEVSTIAGALKASLPEYRDEDFRTPASIMGVEFTAPFDTVGVIQQAIGPRSLEDRYLTEDLPFGYNPLIELAELLGIEVPTLRSIRHLAAVLLGRDLAKEGRTLHDLGLADAGLDQVLPALQWGTRQGT